MLTRRIPQDQLQMGHFYAASCVHDLYQITTPDELEEARASMPFAGGWASRDEALADLLTMDHYGHIDWLEDDKQYARQHRLPAGGWKMLYDNVVGEYIKEQAGGLTLERAIDGRPAHKRGSEFGVLDPAKVLTSQTTIL